MSDQNMELYGMCIFVLHFIAVADMQVSTFFYFWKHLSPNLGIFMVDDNKFHGTSGSLKLWPSSHES